MIKASRNDIYDDANLAQFYDSANGEQVKKRVDFTFCRKLAQNATSVLDLGCGTGEFATSISEVCTVTGAEPATAMLDIARTRKGGERVNWVQGDAQALRLDQKFDLIVLTGHTFQVFLEQSEQMAVLKTIAHHLAPNGQFIFDSRNPDFPAPKTRRTGQKTVRMSHEVHGEIEAWNASTYDKATDVLSYENGYRVLKTNKEFSATAQIKYTPQPVLAEMIEEAGLSVESWFGAWDGTAFTPEAKEIIPLGGRA